MESGIALCSNSLAPEERPDQAYTEDGIYDYYMS